MRHHQHCLTANKSQHGKQNGKQPLLALKRGESSTGILHIGQMEQSVDDGNLAVQGDVDHGPEFGQLVHYHNQPRKQGHKQKLHRNTSQNGVIYQSYHEKRRAYTLLYFIYFIYINCHRTSIWIKS